VIMLVRRVSSMAGLSADALLSRQGERLLA
jgi:hypothetical protein